MSFNITTALTFFVISLLTCFRLPSLCRKVNSKKLTEITFYLHCLSNKISFLSYSIFNLLFTEQKLGASPLGESLSIIPHLSTSCQAFFQTFFGFFCLFFISDFLKPFSSRFLLSSGQLVYITISLSLLSTLFIYFFLLFSRFFRRTVFFCRLTFYRSAKIGIKSKKPSYLRFLPSFSFSRPPALHPHT